MTPFLWPCVSEDRGDFHTYAQNHINVDSFYLFFFPFNEHVSQNASQEISTSIGTATVGGLRLGHPSLWGNRCCHWFTLQACESKSASVTIYSKELWAAAEEKAEWKVNQDVRQDTASTLKTDKWNPFNSSCGKSTWAEERKRETTVHWVPHAWSAVTVLWCLTYLLSH